MNWLRRLSKAADEVERLAESTERLADAQRDVNSATAVNTPGPTLLDSAGRRIMGPLAKSDPFADPARGGQGTSSTSPGYNTGAGTGGPFFDPGGVNSRYNSLAEYRRSIMGPIVFPGNRPGHGNFKKPALDKEKVLVSLDGTLRTNMEVIKFHIFPPPVGTGLGRRGNYLPDGTNVPIEVFDLTAVLGPSGLFPTDQLRGPTTMSTGGGGTGGGGSTSSAGGGGGGGQGFTPFGGPGTPRFPVPPPAVPGSQNTGPGKIQVAPPTEPTPGERAIVQAIRDEAAKTRQQARSDGGTALRAAGLG